MPYTFSDSWETPEDTTIVWRYMSFDKFKSIIEDKALYFFEVLKYRDLGDPKEGGIPEINSKLVGPGFLKCNGVYIKSPEMKSKLIFFCQHFAVVNCWGMDSQERAFRWNNYIKDRKGIAIKSSIERIKNAIEQTKYKIHIGKIKYINYKRDKNKSPNPYIYSMLKDRKNLCGKMKLD